MVLLEAAKPPDIPFEGPEKMLEIHFKANNSSANVMSTAAKASLRMIERTVWDVILKEAGCEIVSSLHGAQVDAYVLSESSLFVKDHDVYLKTCGRTTLLHCIPLLVRHAAKLNLVPVFTRYCRTDFLFPELQPLKNFSQEVKLANSMLTLDDIDSSKLGDLWMYNARMPEKISERSDKKLLVLMYELGKEAREIFSHEGEITSGELMKQVKGLKDCGEDMWDDCEFQPCGYSMNGLREAGGYVTVHVTPEETHSYASVEIAGCECGIEEIESIIDAFKPGRFSVAMFGDQFCKIANLEGYEKVLQERQVIGGTVYDTINFKLIA